MNYISQTIAFVTLVLVSCLVTRGEGEKDTKKPANALVGSWKVVSGKRGGMDSDAPVGDLFTFTEKTMIHKSRSGVVTKMRYSADLSKTPHQIDVYFEKNGKTLTSLGVFKVEKDTLYFCLAPPDLERPAGVESKQGSQTQSAVATRVKRVEKKSDE